MPDTNHKRSAAVDPVRLESIRNLLSRYPSISEVEKEEIVHYLKKGPALDTALLTTIDDIRPKLERFREDHRSQFGIGPKTYLVIMVLIAAILGVCGLLWDSGLG